MAGGVGLRSIGVGAYRAVIGRLPSTMASGSARLAYNPPPMSSRSRRDAASRAEARRRSRQIERGEELSADELEEDDDAADGSAPRGILGRLFPPAPPLPNRPDPLAGLGYQGPFRSVVGGGYLLATNPRAWLLPAMPWAAAQSLAYLSPPTYSPIQIITVLVSVFALIAAGWIGWQRPWLFGLAAAVAGTMIEGIFLAFLLGPLGIDEMSVSRVFTGIVVFQILQLQWILGGLIGWYGGYLRRRMAVPTTRAEARGRRR